MCCGVIVSSITLTVKISSLRSYHGVFMIASFAYCVPLLPACLQIYCSVSNPVYMFVTVLPLNVSPSDGIVIRL